VKHEWSVRVRTDSTQGLTASARNHAWRVGEPITFAPKDEFPSALEMAVGALAADLIGSLRRICRLKRIAFERAELSLRWTLDNPLSYVGVVGEGGHPGISQIEGVLYVSSLDEDRMEGAWQEALTRSPLYNTFQKAAEIDLRLTVTP
jgi:hypothetical protein